MGGWLEQLGIKLISTQVVVEVEVELGKKDSEGGKCITQTGFNWLMKVVLGDVDSSHKWQYQTGKPTMRQK